MSPDSLIARNGVLPRRPLPREGPEREPGAGPRQQVRLPDPGVIPALRSLGLGQAAAPLAPEVAEVAVLEVRDLKGPGETFTPHLDLALQFPGLASKPDGRFGVAYQLLAGDALSDPRLTRLAVPIAFIPAFAWRGGEVVLKPLKVAPYWQRVLAAFQKLRPDFPNFKVLLEWRAEENRHAVGRLPLSAPEAARVARVAWPTRDEVLEALQPLAYDSAEALAAANPAVRDLLAAEEV